MKANEPKGILNLELATETILRNGGGISKRSNYDGTEHVTVYSRSSNQHLSYDVDREGKVCNVHTDKNNHANNQYRVRN